MRNLIALFIFVFLYGTGPSQAQPVMSHNAISCSALYYVISSITYDDEEYGNFFIRLQIMFESVYSAFEEDRLGTSISNKTVAMEKSRAAHRLGEMFDDNQRDQIYALEMQCNEWRKLIFPYLIRLIETEAGDGDQIMLDVPPMPDELGRESARWAQSRDMVDTSFDKWIELGRMTPAGVANVLEN